MFDTLKYTKRLEGAGFKKEQAETSIKILNEITKKNIVTKEDIKILQTILETKFLMIENKFDKKFDHL